MKINTINQDFNSPDEYINFLEEQLKNFNIKSSCDILELKNILKKVHTHITYLMGEQFFEILGIENLDFKYSKMNDHGYDIVTTYNKKRLLAEIKGNIPCKENKTIYGGNQKTGIKKDIDNLLNGKADNRIDISSDEFKDAYKCLILLENNRSAIENYTGNLNNHTEYKDKFKIIYDNSNINKELSNEQINIVFVDLK